MDANRWEEIASILEQAHGVAGAERAALLDRRCGGDATMRAEILSLLEAFSSAPAYFADLAERVAPVMGAIAPAAGPDANLGRIVSHYRILERLGEGGMGVVYRAEDLRLGRAVALKFLVPSLADDPHARERLVREARAASSLDHPNICTIYEVAETPEAQVFIAMACYEGETLKARIGRGPLTLDEVLDIADQIAQGLARAHAQGLVHRDLKPANVMITVDGGVKLLDFGLARPAAMAAITRSGAVMGTLAYMSPEQVRGEAADARSDLWSFGVVLHEMLTGVRPFGGDTDAALLYSILQRPPDPIPGPVADPALGELGELVGSLLRKQRGERLANADEALAVLRRLRGSGESVPPPAADRKGARRWWAGLAGAAVLLALGVFATLPPTPTAVRATLPQTGVAVLPFVVRGGGELAYLREGMVDLLSTKLDGAGELRAIDPNALLGVLAGDASANLDPAHGRELAARFGADRYVLGGVVQLGESIQLHATLYDARGTLLARAETVVNGEARLQQGVDDLAQQLVASQLVEPNEQLASLAAATTAWFPALRAYLEGEQLLRAGRPEAALEALERAVALDSTFALAWYRLARAAGWSDATAALNAQATEQALRHSGSLPRRTRLRVSAYHAYRRGDPVDAERLYREILATWPDDMETWLLLGEALFHNNPFLGRSAAEAREPLLRAGALDPRNREVPIHLMDLAARDRSHAALDSLTVVYRIPVAEGEVPGVRHAYGALPRLVSPTAATRDSAFAELRAAGPDAVVTALVRLAPQLDDFSIGERLALQLTEPGLPDRTRASGALHQAMFEVARGRWSAAELAWQSAAPTAPEWAMIHRVLAHTLPDSPTPHARLAALRREVTLWNALTQPLADAPHVGDSPAIRLYLLGLLSWRMDELAAVREAHQRLEAMAAAGENDLARAFAGTLDALLAWRQGHGGRALAALDRARLRLPFHVRARSPLLEQHWNRYVRAEVLCAEGRLPEALSWYDSLHDGYFHWGAIYLGPSHLRRAEIHDRLGDHDRAIEHYARFAELWRHADPSLQPHVSRARHRLSVLRDHGAAAPPAPAPCTRPVLGPS